MNPKKLKYLVNRLIAVYTPQVSVLLLLLLSTGSVNAQCPYDNANSGVTVTPTCPGTTSAASICAGQFINVNVTAGNIYTFYTCGAAGWDTELTIFPNGGGPFIVEDDDGCTATLQSSVSWLATFTGQVDVLLDDWPCDHIGGNCASIQIDCTLPPTNDDPCTATPLAMNATCNTITASTFGTNTSGVPAPGCAGYAGSDVWFTTVVPASGNFIVETFAGGVTDGGMAIYNAASCAGPFTLVECDDFDGAGNMPLIYLTGQTPGTTVYIRVWEDGNNNNGTFDICAYEANPPVNDDPCGAIALTVSQTCGMTTFTNALSTGTTGVPNPNNCGSTASGAYAGGDVWFTAEVPNTGVLDIETGFGVITDPVIAVYTAPSCSGPFTQIGCDDDAGPGLLAELHFTGLTPGETVYIRVWDYGSNQEGTFDICAYGPIIPAGDCVYILNMEDSGGDGWNLSNVEVNLNGTSTYYTINGASGFAYIGVNLGDNLIVSYNPSGAPNENEITYSLELNGSFIHSAGPTPPSGVVYSINPVDCVQPPPTLQDCAGGDILCQTTAAITMNPSDIGTVNDLNGVNYGCLTGGENQGNWYYMHVSSGGSMQFFLGGATINVDFAIWGPYGSFPTCIPTGSPLRCSAALANGFTGLSSFASDQSEGPTGDRLVQDITVTTGEYYSLYIDNPSQSGQPFSVLWNMQGGADISCSLLPVELLDFNITNLGTKNQLDWSTATEENSDVFLLQRSFDNVEYSTIATLQAAGNSYSTINYAHVDPAPIAGVNYYRLKQVDLDGSYTYSDVVSTVNRFDGIEVVGPFQQQDGVLAMDVIAPLSGELQFELFDLTGRSISGQQMAYNQGVSRLNMSINDMAIGTYIYRVMLPNGEVVKNGKLFLERR